MDPWPFEGGVDAARERLLAILGALPRVEIVALDSDALRCTFRSRLFGFTDDVEFVLVLTDDEGRGLVHFRSASRVGYWDLGANRRRMKELGRRFGSSRS